MILGKNLETIFAAVRDAINRLVNGKQVVGYQTIDVISASVATLTVPAGATEAIMTAEKTGNVNDLHTPVIRWSINSTAPATGAISTTTHGMTMFTTQPPLVIKGSDALSAFKAIAVATTTTGNLMLKVTYLK